MKGVKIKRKTEIIDERIETYDLTVKDSHHYILEDGTVSHNTQDLFSRQVGGGGTGPEYAASIILFLGKAKLKEGTVQTGIIVNAKPNKNRFVQPIPIKFHISFDKGMNPYIGLEEYISWDNCGIGRGKFLTESQFKKLKPEEQDVCRMHTYTEGVEGKDGKKETKEHTVYFQPKETARKLAVKHLNGLVDVNQLFTPEVITKEVLMLMEPIVKEKFSYGTEELTADSLKQMLDLNVEQED